ncbi:GNAT domain-containing protein [Tricladium varicosporioides]|nr:GNAT domain-containing protein [Hymenoscyphus varicosporioides]
MRVNETTAISTPTILLVPYEHHHVHTYNNWMQDPAIQQATASEPLTIEEEYAMQRKWRIDHDKLTFIACLPYDSKEVREVMNAVCGGVHDANERMIGDVNMFLSVDEDDDALVFGELELMIALSSKRRQGLGRATILAFMQYIERHVADILDEFSRGEKGTQGMGQDEKLKNKLQLRVKIGEQNVQSVGLFESLGFVKTTEKANYFGEFELRLPRGVGEDGMPIEKVEGESGRGNYREVQYELAPELKSKK